MTDKLRAAIIATGVSEQIADHLVKIRDDVEGAYRSECERLHTETARLAARVGELERERDEAREYCQAISDLFDPLHAKAMPHNALAVARAAKEAHVLVRTERDAARAEVDRMRRVVDVARRVVSRGIHRRQMHTQESMREVQLLANDIEILTKLAEAVDALAAAAKDGGE